MLTIRELMAAPIAIRQPGEVWPGWYLIGSYESDVGSWLLHHGNEALLLEAPEGLKVEDVNSTLKCLGGPRIKYITASHEHEDHISPGVWKKVSSKFFEYSFLYHPKLVRGYRQLKLGGEPLWLIKAPKHSLTDIVTVFRGIAMVGDIELGTLDSVNKEVPNYLKRYSMNRLREFPAHANYHIHTIVSAHLNDIRTNVDWESLFSY